MLDHEPPERGSSRPNPRSPRGRRTRAFRLLFVVFPLCAVGLLALVAWRSHASTPRASGAAATLLGNPRLASQSDSEPAGRSEAFPFVAQRSGIAAAIYLHTARSNAAHTVQVGIYSDAGGRPGRRLAAGSISRPRAGRWTKATIPHLKVRAGATYWLAVLGSGGRVAYRDERAIGCHSQEAAQTGLHALPAVWKPGRGWSTCFISTYVSGKPTSAPSVAAPPPGPIATRDCFSAPGRCGYPDPTYGNVGASGPCTSLTPSGPVTSTSAGQTIQDLNVFGTITINRPNVTVRNVCVSYNGGSQSGSVAVQILSGAGNTLIENSTIAGYGSGATDSIEMGLKNWSSQPATLSHDYIYNCGECIHDGPWAVNDSYVISNGMQNTGEHYEAVYYNNDVPGAMTFNHDVLLNPQAQSGVLFSDDTTSNSTCAVNLAVKNSLVAGGGGMVSWCGKTTSVGSAVMDIENNHFARCTTPPVTKTGDGGSDCSGATSSAIGSGADSHGYWPFGGHYSGNGMLYCGRPGQIWTGNVWDDNLATLRCTNNG